MSNNATMADDGGWLSKHRHLSIRKTENGYLIEASFPIPPQDKYSASEERRDFVFQELSETIAWANKYLSADASELRQ